MMSGTIYLKYGHISPGETIRYFIYGGLSIVCMHDSEPDTFLYQTWPEKFSDMLREIGVDSQANDVGSESLEGGDYYSRHYSQTPRMVTNRGTLNVKDSNIDMVQIIQKG